MLRNFNLTIKDLLKEVYHNPDKEIEVNDHYIIEPFYFSLVKKGSKPDDSLFHVESSYFIDDEADFTYDKAIRHFTENDFRFQLVKII
jgi:hypothetical protein